MYFPHCRVNICYLSAKSICDLFLLSGREWFFASRDMTVPLVFGVWKRFPQGVLVDGSFFR